MPFERCYRCQGRTLHERQELINDAIAVEKAGASLILLEAMPEATAHQVKKSVNIPVYGIGAGGKLDGQLLILHDVLGTFVGDIQPKFTKRYLNGAELITNALKAYVRDVRGKQFPSKEHLYSPAKVLEWNSSLETEKH